MEKQPGSRSCFVCGRQNPVGLKMSWYNDEENQRVIGTVAVPEHFNGYPGVVHGGIVAAILDETAGRAVLLNGSDENLMVTVKLEVHYRRPTPTNVPLTVVGWAIKQTARRARVAGEIRLPDGTVTAECEAIIARPSEEVRRNWDAEKPYWRVDEEE